MALWQVQEAKAGLSEVIDQAVNEGPQTITRHGKARAILISVDEYESMKSKALNFADFLLSGPKSMSMKDAGVPLINPWVAASG